MIVACFKNCENMKIHQLEPLTLKTDVVSSISIQFNWMINDRRLPFCPKIIILISDYQLNEFHTNLNNHSISQSMFLDTEIQTKCLHLPIQTRHNMLYYLWMNIYFLPSSNEMEIVFHMKNWCSHNINVNIWIR